MTNELLNQAAADAVDNENPRFQQAQIGERIKEIQDSGLVAQRVDVTAAANSTPKSFTVDYDMVLVDVVLRATAAASAGTLQLRRATTGITNAIACATDLTIGRAGTISDAGRTLVAGETLNLIAAGTGASSVRGEVVLIGYRV